MCRHALICFWILAVKTVSEKDRLPFYLYNAFDNTSRTRLPIRLKSDFPPKYRKIPGRLLGRRENRKGIRVREALKPRTTRLFFTLRGAYEKELRLYPNRSPYLANHSNLDTNAPRTERRGAFCFVGCRERKRQLYQHPGINQLADGFFSGFDFFSGFIRQQTVIGQNRRIQNRFHRHGSGNTGGYRFL